MDRFSGSVQLFDSVDRLNGSFQWVVPVSNGSVQEIGAVDRFNGSVQWIGSVDRFSRRMRILPFNCYSVRVLCLVNFLLYRPS